MFRFAKNLRCSDTSVCRCVNCVKCFDKIRLHFKIVSKHFILKFSRYQYLDLAKKMYNNSKKEINNFFLFDLNKMYSSNQYPNILLRCSYRGILARIFKCNSRILLDMQKQNGSKLFSKYYFLTKHVIWLKEHQITYLYILQS